MKQTILVTGAAGFIGSHLTESLLKRGDTVIGIDNFNNYYDPQRKHANIREIKLAVKDADLEILKGDIRDETFLDEIFQKHHFDAVVNLAAMAGVRASIEDPSLYYNVNLNGTLQLLKRATKHSVKNFVQASTSSAYGATKTIPFIETDSADRPLAPYPASKRSAEMLGYTYHHLDLLNFTALRFFTVYGPRGRPDMMAYKVLNSIFFGEVVPLFNNGQMHRDWTHVKDIVQGIIAAIDKPLGYEIINLGRGEPTLLADFVRMIEDLTQKKATFDSQPMMKADVGYTFADIRKAQTLLGYRPEVSVEQGVREFWLWYQKNVLQ